MSLGGTESLAEYPSTLTHADSILNEQHKMGITRQIVRLNIGVENPQDSMLDLGQPFEAVRMVKEWALELA